MTRVFLLKLDNGATLEVRADSDLELKPHDMCVFLRDYYTDMGELIRELAAPSMTANAGELPAAQRAATREDLLRSNENLTTAKNALRTAQGLIDNLNLPMKLINAHYSLDGKLVTIQFSADGRVDFRELVKELSRALATRIELRQIGVRDETGIYGGIAVCGQRLCCCRYLKEFNSINVKMAKEQDLSLTPATISGICGRLKCCLKFEHEGYLEMSKNMPRKGEYCDTPSGHGRITDRNLLTRRVSVGLESGNIVQFCVDEITITPPPERRPAGDRNPDRGDDRNGARRNGDDRKRPGDDRRRPNCDRNDRNDRNGGRRDGRRDGRQNSTGQNDANFDAVKNSAVHAPTVPTTPPPDTTTNAKSGDAPNHGHDTDTGTN